jgi:hypothetical protein
MLRFKKEIKSEHKIGIYRANPDKNHMACSLQIKSKKLINTLKNHGICERKSGHETLPKISKKLQHHFWRGFFDGDGWITKRRRKRNEKIRNVDDWTIGLCCGSLQFLTDFKNWINNETNRICGCFYKKSEVDISLTFEGNVLALAIAEALYREASIFMPRKYERYIKLKKQQSK